MIHTCNVHTCPMLTQQCKFHPVTDERTIALFWPDFMMHVKEGMCWGLWPLCHTTHDDLYLFLRSLQVQLLHVLNNLVCMWKKKVPVDYTDAGPKALSKSKSTTTVNQMSNYRPTLAVFIVLLHCVQVAFAIVTSCHVQNTPNRSDTQATAMGCQRLQHCPLVWDGVVHFCTGQTGKYSIHQLSSSRCCCYYYNYNSYCRPSLCIFSHTHTHTHTHTSSPVFFLYIYTDIHTYTHTYIYMISHIEQSSWKSVYML